jgi:hypothetical protein
MSGAHGHAREEGPDSQAGEEDAKEPDVLQRVVRWRPFRLWSGQGRACLVKLALKTLCVRDQTGAAKRRTDEYLEAKLLQLLALAVEQHVLLQMCNHIERLGLLLVRYLHGMRGGRVVGWAPGLVLLDVQRAQGGGGLQASCVTVSSTTNPMSTYRRVR